jgi:hypothetical protein
LQVRSRFMTRVQRQADAVRGATGGSANAREHKDVAGRRDVMGSFRRDARAKKSRPDSPTCAEQWE